MYYVVLCGVCFQELRLAQGQVLVLRPQAGAHRDQLGDARLPVLAAPQKDFKNKTHPDTLNSWAENLNPLTPLTLQLRSPPHPEFEALQDLQDLQPFFRRRVLDVGPGLQNGL